MRLLVALYLSVACFSWPFDPQLPKRYLVDEMTFDHAEGTGQLVRLVFDEAIFFVEKPAQKEVNAWKSGDRIAVHRATKDQPIVALCYGKKALMAHVSAALPKIERHAIRFFSLRCSGSTYMQLLLRQNFPTMCFGQDLGWKHGPSGPSIQGFCRQADGIDELVDQGFKVQGERLKNPATIMIVRGPYNWIRSLYKNAWWVLHPSYGTMPFSEFLRTPVRIVAHQPSDINFFENKPYNHPIEMRSAKLKLLLALTCRSLRHFVINYETLLDNAPAVIAHIASEFNWRPKAIYEPVDCRIRSRGQKFEMPIYPDLGDEERAFIKEHLDVELEKLLSYEL